MLNKVVLMGRLVRDPELRYSDSGDPFCIFTLAVERNFTNKEGEKEADFIDIVSWRKIAENCSQYLEKGMRAIVEGRIQIRKNEQEERVYINPEVVANNVQFIDWPNHQKNNVEKEESIV